MRWGRSESKRMKGKFEGRKIKRGTMKEIMRATVRATVPGNKRERFRVSKG